MSSFVLVSFTALKKCEGPRIGVKISSRKMGLGPGSSTQFHIEVNPVMVGCPQQVNPTVNRLLPVDKASIHSRQGLQLLAEGALGEATVSATVSEMDEGGNTERGRVCLGQMTSLTVFDTWTQNLTIPQLPLLSHNEHKLSPNTYA